MDNLILEFPLVILKGLTLVPTTTVHFDVNNEAAIRAIEASLHQEQLVFFITDKNKMTGKMDARYEIGVIGKVKQIMKLPQGASKVLIEAKSRARLLDVVEGRVYRCAHVELVTQEEKGELTALQHAAYKQCLLEILSSVKDSEDKLSQAISEKLQELEDIEALFYAMTEYFGLTHQEKQEIIEILPLKDQIQHFIKLAKEKIGIQKIRDEIESKTRANVTENQKEYVLREQMKAIRQELGEETVSDDAREYFERLENLQCPDEVKERIQRDIKRFSNISSSSSESTVLRTYIETLLSYPWGKSSKLSNSLQKAIDILERDHYGLKKVKERVVDTLAVQMLADKAQAPIICLVGPPGTGKTSIARSIASATNRQYERISLGGVRDEAEIRGHRKTYVGAMPGRIATAMMHAKVENPLLLLDEIDKVSKDYKGDTASALLEVLDGEQNNQFVDHYFEVPIDLSQVLFIATANDASQIPKPLLDRMELIEVNSYTENEKFHIAKLYLIEKQIRKNGLNKRQFKIEDEALTHLISAYTKEAGVRTLERTIGKLCQIAARKIVLGEQKSLHVKKSMLEDLLGTEKYRKEDVDLSDKVGCVTGLAWTAVGGDTLEVEVNVSDGQGKLKLTGNLGDVMKESAEIAVSHVRTLLPKKEAKGFFDKHDLHIHVPEGATPKDGPSAGITMTTAIYSAITKQPVRGDIAMTGEVTLTGRVLPIGGLKEKLLAAKQAQKTEVILPDKNRANVAELDAEILEGMTITYVTTTKEVVEQACITQ